MRTLDVSLPALPRAAEGLLSFAADLPRAEATPVEGELQEALTEFCRSWSSVLDGLAHEARTAAADVTVAARTYARLERLLMGGVRR